GSAVDAALRMEAAGADLIDVGAESTRPGAMPVSVDEELRRVIPVVERLSRRLDVPISVDTTKARVAADAVAAGAAIVNDVRGLRDDAALAEAIASTSAALVLMHSRGTPETMARQATYDDVVADVASELREAMRRAAASSSTRASGLPNALPTVMVCWRACRNWPRRWTARCSSGRRASRSWR